VPRASSPQTTKALLSAFVVWSGVGAFFPGAIWRGV
jgi:hypothetical protein